MGTYYIPRNVKGESRILYIFTVKSLIITLIFAFIGFLLYMLFSSIGLTKIGVITLIIFALIGFGLGTIKIPKIAGIPFTSKVCGDQLGDIIVRYFKFLKNRKMYTYTYVDTEKTKEETK